MGKMNSKVTFGTFLYLSLISAANAAGARYREPISSRSPNIEDYRNDPCGQKMALIESELYFIDDGHIFRKNLESGKITLLKNSHYVKSIMSYEGQLFALQQSASSSPGTPYLWDPESQGWFELGNSTRDLYVIGQDLVAHTQNDQLWIFGGKLRGGDAALITWTIPIAERWSGAGREFGTYRRSRIAFFDSQLRQVKHVEPICENGKVTDAVLILSNGQKLNYIQHRGSE